MADVALFWTAALAGQPCCRDAQRAVLAGLYASGRVLDGLTVEYCMSWADGLIILCVYLEGKRGRIGWHSARTFVPQLSWLSRYRHRGVEQCIFAHAVLLSGRLYPVQGGPLRVCVGIRKLVHNSKASAERSGGFQYKGNTTVSV